MKKEYHGPNFPVECYECGRVFDFADYLTSDDENRHIAELVIEKCGGDVLLCDRCRNFGRRIIERGRFELVTEDFENGCIGELELTSNSGKKTVLKIKNVSNGEITFKLQ